MHGCLVLDAKELESDLLLLNELFSGQLDLLYGQLVPRKTLHNFVLAIADEAQREGEDDALRDAIGAI